jgi:hypothetical protein
MPMRKALLATALVLCAAAADAQPNRGFAIRLPCAARQSGTESHIIMRCETGDGAFAIEMLLDPEQTPRDQLYADAVARIASELGTKPRLVQDITRGGRTGREIVTDLAGGQTQRDQLWQSPYVLFEIRFKGATGSETGKAATDFLDSFSPNP